MTFLGPARQNLRLSRLRLPRTHSPWPPAWCAFAAIALLVGAETARAETSVELVSKTGQATAISRSFSSDSAQRFDTGSNPAGYKLTCVDLPARSISATEPTCTVRIHSHGSDSPASSLATLTNPSNLPTGGAIAQFAAPADGIDLDPNTTYWVLVDVSTGDSNSQLLSDGFPQRGCPLAGELVHWGRFALAGQ